MTVFTAAPSISPRTKPSARRHHWKAFGGRQKLKQVEVQVTNLSLLLAQCQSENRKLKAEIDRLHTVNASLEATIATVAFADAQLEADIDRILKQVQA